MQAALALLLIGIVASWVVAFLAAIQFARVYRRWQTATGRPVRWTDPAKNFEDFFHFLRGYAEPLSEAGRHATSGRRLGKLALAAGCLFAALVVTALVVGCSGGQLTCSRVSGVGACSYTEAAVTVYADVFRYRELF